MTPITPPTTRHRQLGGSWILFVGPAFVTAAAYGDPGNFATNVTAGARYGPKLLWVVVVASLAAILVQYLSAKLGLLTGLDLAELSGRESQTWLRRLVGWQAVIAVAMTDLAELVGAGLGLQMLVGVPVAVGAVGAAAFSLVFVAWYGERRRLIEIVVGAVVLALLIVMVVELASGGGVGLHAASGLVPRIDTNDELVLAAGIIGATVMPHAVFLHSYLAKRARPGNGSISSALRATRLDIAVALGIATALNVTLLLFGSLLPIASDVSLVDVHTTIGHVLGSACAMFFGVALLFSGVASACVGTYSGQVVLAAARGHALKLWKRRLLILIPALSAIALGLSPTRALVLSQVFISLSIPLTLFILVRATSNRRLMGAHVNRRTTTVAAWVTTALISLLNGALVALAAA